MGKARRLSAAAVASIAVVTASAGMFAGVLATPGAGALAPVITHPVRHVTAGHGQGQGSSSAAWAASNWSGYAETGTFTSVSGGWTVPTATAGAVSGSRFRFFRHSTNAWYSAAWLGIDGFNDSSLIQTGTEHDYYNGSAHYSAWWEILPAAETVIPKPVTAGDVMTATITETATVVNGKHIWTITLADTTQKWSFTTSQAYSGAGSSAEWIVEAPSVNGQIATLADYAFPGGAANAGDFNNAAVATTIGGALSGAGLNYTNDAGVMIQNNAQVSTPGPQDTPATAFNALYGATAPAAPTS